MAKLESYNLEELSTRGKYDVLPQGETQIRFVDLKDGEEAVQEDPFTDDNGKVTRRFVLFFKDGRKPLRVSLGVFRDIVEYQQMGKFVGVKIRRTGTGIETDYDVKPLV